VQTIRQLAANLNDAFVPPKRGRGRPSKPTDKTPCCVPFKDVAAATKGIPPDESGKPGRNQAKERARKIIAEDGRILGRAPLAISNVLLDDMRWNKGLISHSLNHLAKVTKVHLSTVKRVLNLLEDCGHIRRKPKAERRLTAKGDDLVIEKTTYSPFVSTGIDDELRKRGIRRLYITGLHTDCCARHASGDAFQRGYDLVWVTDALPLVSVVPSPKSQ
jgi:DNA-binding transcriptional regulator YhcF (GntR family)